MSRKAVVLGTAHRMREPGKESTDKRLKECVWSREVVSEIKAKLEAYDVTTFIDYLPLDLEKNMQTPSVSLERQRELALRANEVNAICEDFGKENVLYVSIHVDASPFSDGKWHDCRGWSVRCSPVASNRSHLLASALANMASYHDLKVRKPKPEQCYWEQSLYVLNRTNCPAVLTENLFMDNKEDVDFLLSDAGRHAIERLHVEGILGYLKQIEMT
jgi:N-acetylmuramoyl-L-alanine amidase